MPYVFGGCDPKYCTHFKGGQLAMLQGEAERTDIF